MVGRLDVSTIRGEVANSFLSRLPRAALHDSNGRRIHLRRLRIYRLSYEVGRVNYRSGLVA
jgi:hypothetical protein